MRNHSLATAKGAVDVETVVGQIESAVAQCFVPDHLSAEESYVDLTHSVRTMTNPNGVNEKSDPLYETLGCLVVSTKEMVGIGLGPKQLEAHFSDNLSPMSTSVGFSEAGNFSKSFSGPLSSSFTPDGSGEKPTVFPDCLEMPVAMSRSVLEGSFSVSQSIEASQVGDIQRKVFILVLIGKVFWAQIWGREGWFLKLRGRSLSKWCRGWLDHLFPSIC